MTSTPEQLTQGLHRELQPRPEFAMIAKERQTLHIHLRGIKMSFLGYSCAVLLPMPSFLGAAIADPRDIACMKVNDVAGRGTKRDFVDLYAAAEHYGLSRRSWNSL